MSSNIPMHRVSRILKYTRCKLRKVSAKKDPPIKHIAASPLWFLQPPKCLSSEHPGGRLGGSRSRRFLNYIKPLETMKRKMQQARWTSAQLIHNLESAIQFIDWSALFPKLTIPNLSFRKHWRTRPALPRFVQQGYASISQAKFLWWLCRLCLKWMGVHLF